MNWEIVGLIVALIALSFTLGWWAWELRLNRAWEKTSLYRKFANLLPSLNDTSSDGEGIDEIIRLRNEIRIVGSPETYKAVDRVLQVAGASEAPGRGSEAVGEVLDAMRRDVGNRTRIDRPYTLVGRTKRRE